MQEDLDFVNWYDRYCIARIKTDLTGDYWKHHDRHYVSVFIGSTGPDIAGLAGSVAPMGGTPSDNKLPTTMVYKPWLCSQHFQTTQMHCSKRIPCGQYCLEVQQRCPFVLPDNDDLIHGGSPSFICTGLLEDYPSGVDPNAECCDVRWDMKVDNRSRGTLKRTHPPCQHRTSLSSSAACRLCNSRLKLCLLVLVPPTHCCQPHCIPQCDRTGPPRHHASGGEPCQRGVIQLPGGGEVVGVGDSPTMATSVEKYSHSCANGSSCVPVDILQRFLANGECGTL
ncbi:hypothetical protein L3Q82_017557 [Scortum barcoo]|uniref:Uncharacterized protein n=1 Tax=Scortum barcoo TaxID=214431 RepID=A0ACB8VLH0_9TELE|nr:hypothetical protein L3Q82_017557 [Scortum barcoo]